MIIVCVSYKKIIVSYNDPVASVLLGKNVTLLKINHVNANIIQKIASLSPEHLRIIDCKGTLMVEDAVQFFMSVGNRLKVRLLHCWPARTCGAIG